MVTIVDDAPHPRILFEEVPDAVFAELAPLAGTAQRVSRDASIHASDWDLLVTSAPDAGRRDKSLHVLSFGAEELDRTTLNSDSRQMTRGHETQARRGVVAEGLDQTLCDLVRRTIVDQISEDAKSTWVIGVGWDDSMRTEDLAGTVVPLVHIGQERYVYALERRRRNNVKGSALCWALPARTVGHREWLLYVLDRLRTDDPDRFPSDPDWQSRDTWAPPALAKAMHQLSAHDAETESVLKRMQERREALVREVSDLAVSASAGVWRLLNSQGDELVSATIDVLTDLGFRVRNMDGHHDEKTGAKLEDLRVTDPDDPEWECLVEVKGYTKGAKVRDISQIVGRPSVHYAAEEGHVPSTVWHVVNTFLATDPTARPDAVPSDLDLQPLTDAGGALIDTRDLFRAWRDTKIGAVAADDVRRSMRTAVTRWSGLGPPASSLPETAVLEIKTPKPVVNDEGVNQDA